MTTSNYKPTPLVTDRQQKIYDLIREGLDTKEICKKLGITANQLYFDVDQLKKADALTKAQIREYRQNRIQKVELVYPKQPKKVDADPSLVGMVINLVDTLNAKEREAYDLLLLGLTNEDIGERLQITSYAVLKRLRNVYKKLGIESANRHDMYSARQRAIAYGGTKIEQSVTVSQSGYSENQIRFAAMKLVSNGIYDSKLVNGFVADLMLVLEKKI